MQLTSSTYAEVDCLHDINDFVLLFFLYLTSPRRQLVAPVACTVIFADSSCDPG